MRGMARVVFAGGSRGTSQSLDLTFPPIILSENIGEWKGGGGGGKGGGDHLHYSPPLASASNTTLGMATLPQGNQELLVVRHMVGSWRIGVSTKQVRGM